MLSTSKNANINYLAKLVKLTHLRPHGNANNLQCAMIDGNNVIVSIHQKVGDVGIFFPLESKIDASFLKVRSLYREKSQNFDQTKAGFFELNGRVRAVKLRSEQSEGFWVPLADFQSWVTFKQSDLIPQIGKEFDTFGDKLLLSKYIPTHVNTPGETKKQKFDKTKKVKQKDLLIPGQFNFHANTPQFGKNIHRFTADSNVTVTKKLHGTSLVSSRVLIKRELSWKERLAKFLGVSVVESEYKNLFSSRTSIRNLIPTRGSDSIEANRETSIYAKGNALLEPFLQDGMTVYAELVGFVKPHGTYIQKGYDYGCSPGSKHFKLYVYRITWTNPAGKVFEWSWQQIKLWCQQYGINHVPELFTGSVYDFLDESLLEGDSSERFYLKLKERYLERQCTLCANKVPDEGVCVRVNNSLAFEVFKLKSFAFRQHETKMLDAGEIDIETQDSVDEV
jgi:hypothetical protein